MMVVSTHDDDDDDDDDDGGDDEAHPLPNQGLPISKGWWQIHFIYHHNYSKDNDEGNP